MSLQFTVLGAVLGAFVGLSSGESGVVSRSDVEAAYQLWQESGYASYDMTFAWSCFCEPCFTSAKLIGVRQDTITSVEFDNLEESEAQMCDEINLDTSYYDTVNQLFTILLDNIDTAFETIAEFDGDTGYPISVYIDKSEMIADEEVIWSISSLECVDRIVVSSLDNRNWNVDLSGFVGNYDYDGFDGLYPIYVHESGLASITVALKDESDLEYYYRFYDNDGTTLLGDFWTKNYNPTLMSGMNGNYIDITSNNPFNANTKRWSQNGIGNVAKIDVTATLDDTCNQLGFDA